MSYFDIGPIKKVSFVDKFTEDEVLKLDDAWVTTSTRTGTPKIWTTTSTSTGTKLYPNLDTCPSNQFFDEDMLDYLLSEIIDAKAKEAEKKIEEIEIEKTKKNINMFRHKIKEVIFNDPAVIIKWVDGTKTVVKCQKGEKFDPEKGLALAIVKYLMGNIGYYNTIFKDWID